MALVKELFLKELTGVVQSSRIARAHFLEELDQGSFGNGVVCQIPVGFLFNSGSNEHTLRIVVHILEDGENLFIGSMLDWRIFDAITDSCQGTQEHRNWYGAFAVELEDNVI